MRRTVYKNSDWASDACDYTPNVKLDSVVRGPYLVEKVFINEKTGKRVESDFLQLVVLVGGNLKPTLKEAMKLLAKSGKVGLEFEFDGLKFNIAKEDRFEDVYEMISSVVKVKHEAEAKLRTLRSANELDL